MKKIIVLLLFTVMLQAKAAEEKICLLVNPTVNNIKTFQHLIEIGILSVSHLKIVGIYDLNHHYDFDKSSQYLQDESISSICLEGYSLHIPRDSLFLRNRQSETFQHLFLNADAIIFTGGPDIPPSVYGEKTHLTTRYIPEGRLYELSFLFHLLGGSQNPEFKPFLEEKPDFIVLGICLGMQMMNVATGGTLIQDIPSEVYQIYYVEDILKLPCNQQHRNYWPQLAFEDDVSYFTIHPVGLVSGSVFDMMAITACGSDYPVLSSHHQCIQTLGRHLKISAFSSDEKIIEAIEHETYRHVFGVQFHPEHRGIYDDAYQYKFRPSDEKHAIKEILGDTGMSFHRAFWIYFSALFSN